MHELTALLVRAATVREVAHAVVTGGRRVVAADGAVVALVTTAGLEVLEEAGTVVDGPVRESALAAAAEERRLVRAAGEGGSVVAVPVTAGGCVAAVVGFGVDAADAVMPLCRAVADLAGEALERARRFDVEATSHATLLHILGIAPDFGAVDTPEAVADAVCREAVEAFGVAAASVVRVLDGVHTVLESRRPASTLLPPGRTYATAELPGIGNAGSRRGITLSSDRRTIRVPVTIRSLTRRELVLEWADDAPPLDPEALLVLQRFADQAGLALEQAERRRAEEEATQNTRQTNRLLTVSAALAAAPTLDDVAAVLVAQGREQTGAAAAAVLVVDGSTPSAGEARTPFDDAVSTREVVLVESPDERERRYPGAAAGPHRAWASVPLTVGAAVVGVVELSFADERTFDARDRGFLAAFGRQGGLALERARLHAEEVRAREEAELRASAAQALEFVAEGVFMLDDDGIVRVWNPATADLTGLGAHEVLGRRLAEALPAWEEFVANVPVARAGESRTTPRTLPLETERGEVWISISGIRFDTGRVYAFRDVTDEHRLDRLKSDFVATISHELRTPLAVLYGGAATLGRDDVDLAPGDRRRMLEMMVSEGGRLQRLVDRILFSSSLETDAARSRPALFDAAAVTRDVVGELRAATAAPIEFSAVPGLERLVHGDRDHLREILANLIDNAVKYSPPGSGVRVTAAAVRDRLRIAVEDEGIGVAPGDRERIFDKFYRADSQLTMGVRGTGLGLYIVRELVSRMGGRVWVERPAEVGSRFVVELPTEPAPPSE